MKFILPRLFGLALLAGIASFLLAMIFKVLIGAVIIGTIVYFASKAFGRRRKQGVGMQYQGHYPADPFGYRPQQPFAGFDRQPMQAAYTQRNPGIVPIN
jgi:hypothetical protein